MSLTLARNPSTNPIRRPTSNFSSHWSLPHQVKPRSECGAIYARECFIPFPSYLSLTKALTYCREGRSCPKKDKILTNEHTTLHRHVASLHLVSLRLFFPPFTWLI